MKRVITVLLMVFCISSCTYQKNSKQVINVLNWSSYIPDSVISDFEDEYKIKVNYSTYSSNEELLAKVSSSKKGTYDVIFPSDYMIDLMISKNMLEELDKTKFKNIDNINPIFLRQVYDMQNNYSLPFLLATSVIAVNKDNITEDITSYNDLLNDKYENDIVFIDDQRIIIGACLQALGYDINDTDKNHLEEAKDFFLKLKKNIKAFDSDSPKSFLITNEVNIGLIWNAEAILAKETNKNIDIIYPSDGYAISMDNYAIVSGSKNLDNAYLFIDYLLRDDVCQKIVDEYPYISTNKNVNTLTDGELNNILNRGSYIKNIGESIKDFDKTWAKMK